MRRHGRLWIPEAPNLILDRGPAPRKTQEGTELAVDVGLAGHFKWELLRGGEVVQEGEMHNLITDAGLNALAGQTHHIDLLLSYIGVGTNNTAPDVSQTQLLAQEGGRINRTTTGHNAAGSAPDYLYWYRRLVYLFLEAESNGNLAELGLFSTAAAGVMFTRQLFKDLNGDPVVVTKTANDQLRITYEIRTYPPANVTLADIVIDGVNYTPTMNVVNVSTARTWGDDATNFAFLREMGRATQSVTAQEPNVVLARTASPPGGGSGGTITPAAYVAGTFYRDHVVVWQPAGANFATGVGSLIMAVLGANGIQFYSTFTPKIPKIDTKRLTATVRVTLTRA